MSVVCENVPTLTTALITTADTVYVSIVSTNIPGPVQTSTLLIPSSSCSTSVNGNSSTLVCTTKTVTSISVINSLFPEVATVTDTGEVVQTLFSTLFGSVCSAISEPPAVSPDDPVQPTNVTISSTSSFSTSSSRSSSIPSPNSPSEAPAQPTPQTTPQPTPQPPAVTSTTTTQIVTVTSRSTSTKKSTSSSNAPPSSTSSLSRTTIYGSLTSDPDPSDTAIGAISSSTSSNTVSVGAIAGGVVGGLASVVLLGLLGYFLIYKKLSKNGNNQLSGENTNDQHETTNDGLDPKMLEQGGIHTFQDGLGPSQQLQGSAVPAQYSQLQGFDGHNLYTNPQGTQFAQQNMAQPQGNSQGTQFLQQNTTQSQGLYGQNVSTNPQGTQFLSHDMSQSQGLYGQNVSTNAQGTQFISHDMSQPQGFYGQNVSTNAQGAQFVSHHAQNVSTNAQAQFAPHHMSQTQGPNAQNISTNAQGTQFAPQNISQAQGFDAQNVFTNAQGTQYVPQLQGIDAPDVSSNFQGALQNIASGAVIQSGMGQAALPAGAAAAAVVGYSHHRSSSSESGSHKSTAPLLDQGPIFVPYRGYAEPVDD